MNRFLTMLTLILVASLSAIAQQKLAIMPLLDNATSTNPSAEIASVEVSGKQLKPHNLSIYKSLSVSGDAALAEKMERAVMHDGTSAESREVSLRDGRLYFGFYTMPPAGNENRYIFYLNATLAGGSKTTIIYMQGKAGEASIRKMIKKQ